MEDKDLLEMAVSVKENAYAPYSQFRVGAAVLTESGNVYTGVNIENASFGATNCAERTAIFKAVTDRERSLKAVAIASDSDEYILPCGICRQVMAEFAGPEFRIICSKTNGEYKIYRLDELMPQPFDKFKTKRAGR